MRLRKWRKRVKGKTEEYWALVESYRTARGPRQWIVAYLGEVGEAAREGVARAARGERRHQPRLLEEVTPEWVEGDATRLRVERVREFGGSWLGLQVLEKLGLGAFLQRVLPSGREEIPWASMAQVLVLGRLCDPSRELALAERVYARTALMDLLGVPAEKVNDDRLYRALDALLPHQGALEKHLKERLGSPFSLEYDLLLSDVTSTYPPEAGELRGDGRGQWAGAAGLLAGPSTGLLCLRQIRRGGPTGMHRPGGEQGRDAVGIPGVCRESGGREHGRRDRGADRRAVWSGRSHLRDGSRDGE